MVHVLHAHWRSAGVPPPTQSGAILFWAEVSLESGAKGDSSRNHPFCTEAETLQSLLAGELLGHEQARAETFTLLLPSSTRRPLPSPELGAMLDRKTKTPALRPWNITGLRMDPVEAVATLMEWLEEERTPADVRLGASVRYWQRAASLALEALAQQRLVPSLKRFDDALYARWLPLLDGHRVAELGETMPPVCRAGTDLSANRTADGSPAPEALLRDFFEETCDALARAWTSAPEATQDPLEPGSRWVHSLFGRRAPIEASAAQLESLERSHRLWLRNLKLAGDEHFRVALRLSAPDPPPDPGPDHQEQDTWLLDFFLQARDDPSLLVGAADIWHGGEALAGLRRLKDPQEKLLAGLGYAVRFFAPLERTLQESSSPSGVELNAQDAFRFMRECAPLLEEAGFGVLVPPWWNRSSARLRLRPRVSPASSSDGEGVARGMMSLEGLMNYRWELSLGEQTLSQEEFETLAALKSPLIRLRGEWVRLDPEQVEKALEFFSSQGLSQGSRQNGESQLSPQEALRLGLGGVEQVEGLEVEDATFEDWLAEWFERLDGERKLGTLPAPAHLRAELRPYQQAGYSWLEFLRGSALGACLADDMGLGKTIQTLALFSRDQEQGLLESPVLVVCPTSVVSNWHKEAERFTPNLRVLIHQGPGRLQDKKFAAELEQTDLVVTSYALLRRDAGMLQSVEWHAVVLDEAQNIKNPGAQQSKLAYGLSTNFRLALTGTPVENRLAELWTIMRFLNPGYLGSQKEFRRRFARPIERERDQKALRDLHKLTRPLILRRLKSDPKIIDDLPDKQEMKVYAHLSEEQASLYEAVVRDVMEELEESEGIQRKGLVLSMLTRLKQVCNHPAQFMHEGTSKGEAGNADSDPSGVRGAGSDARSGKLLRLLELLDEILSVGDRCLIFTQYREMGALLHQLLPERFACEVQFIHGGTSAKKRTEMVRRFQEDEEGPQVFILSLKAGGTGLNLTRANHVFHFDRWWNPAVEDQATDRAFRIGQKRNVEVHKFVCVGTLEERIDEMIEQKKALAQSVVGSDEAWITELSDRELREMVALRREAMA
jgi:SNF2 family DNA or RNA helicase